MTNEQKNEKRSGGLKTAAGVTLAAAGAVSALFLTLNGGATSASPAPEPTVVTEYVDLAGNPVAPPVVGVQGSQPLQTDEPNHDEAYEDEEHEDEAYDEAEEHEAEHDEYEEGEYEDDDDYEEDEDEEDEHEDHDEYEDDDEYEDHG